MAITLKELDALPQELVDETYAQIVQLVQEYNPDVDVKRGVISDIVLMLSSVLTAANRDLIERDRQSRSLKAITEDPTLADTDTVDQVASNFLTIRKLGTAASGPVVIIVNTLRTIVVNKGTQFATDTGITFAADETYTARTTAGEVVASTDRLLRSMGDGTYSFVISVTATEVGTDGQIVRNTRLVPPAIDNAITNCYASSDFSGGTDDESNEALTARLAASMSSKTLTNRTGIEGFVRALELEMYDEGLAVSSVGYGDGEQLRYHSIFPVAFGGRVDTYVRTKAKLETQELIKTATLVGSTAGGVGIWQFSFSRDDAPGFYEVLRVTKPANIANLAIASYAITQDVRGFDLTTGSTAGLTFFPDLANATEAAYSRYQTATVQFQDTDTSLAGLTIGVSTASYGLVLSLVPGLELIQDAVAERANRSPASDCLVKAPVPCFMSATLNISKAAADPTPDTSAIQEAAAAAVNTTGFTNRMPASTLISGIQSLLSGSMRVSSVTMQGTVRRPDGTLANFASSDVLDVGSSPSSMVTKYTVGFFLNPSDITVNVSVVA